MSRNVILFLVMAVLVLASEVRAQQDPVKETKFVTAQEPTRMVDIRNRIAELELAERQIQEQMSRPESDKPVPDESYYELRVSIRAEMIELRKEYEKLDKERYKSETKVRRQARNQLQKEADEQLKQKNRQADAFRSAHVEVCTPEETTVYPIAIANSLNSRVSFTVHNPRGGEPFDIFLTGEIPVVRNLCSGGQVTVSMSRSWFDGGSTIVYLTAKTKSGRLAISQAFYLSYLNEQYFSGQPRKIPVQWIPFHAPTMPLTASSSAGFGGVASSANPVSGNSGSMGDYQWPWWVIEALQPPSRVR